MVSNTHRQERQTLHIVSASGKNPSRYTKIWRPLASLLTTRCSITSSCNTVVQCRHARAPQNMTTPHGARYPHHFVFCNIVVHGRHVYAPHRMEREAESLLLAQISNHLARDLDHRAHLLCESVDASCLEVARLLDGRHLSRKQQVHEIANVGGECNKHNKSVLMEITD